MKRIPLAMALAAALALRCTEGPTEVSRGGGGSEVVGIAGALTRVDGSPAAGASIRLRPRYFLPSGDPVPPGGAVDTTADAAGAFRIDSVPRGEYVLEAGAGESLGVALALTLTGDVPEMSLGRVALKPTGTVAGSFVPPAGFLGRTTVEIFGLDRRAQADSLSGGFRLVGMPEGVYTLRAVFSAPAVDPREVEQVQSQPGAITDIGSVQLASFENENYAAWPRSRRIILNTTSAGAGVAGNVDDFPLLVRLDSGTFDFSQSRGADIRFSDETGQRLRFEIERWDSAAARAEIWVALDRVLGNSASQFITVHWGLPGAPNWSDGRRVFGPADFAGVWHLAEEAPDTSSDDRYADAAGYNHADDRISATGREGVIGHGHAFDGDDYLVVPVADDRLKPLSKLSVSAWVQVLGTGREGGNLLSMGDNYNLRVTDQRRGRFTLFDGNTRMAETQNPMLTDSAWHHLAGTYDGAVMRLYLDGVPVASAPTTGPIRYNLSPSFVMGRHGNKKAGFEFTGNLDEAQVTRDVARSPDWIKLSYENQKPGSTLLEFAPATPSKETP